MLVIAVSGVTCVGKSSLARRLASALKGKSYEVEYVDERRLQVPYVRQMFRQPIQYAYWVECYFAVARANILVDYSLRLKDGILLMERSLTEDMIHEKFWREELGAVSADQHRAYLEFMSVANSLRLDPNFYIYLRCPVEESLIRLNRRESMQPEGPEVPIPFRPRYVSGMARLYEEWFTTVPEERILAVDSMTLADETLSEEKLRSITEWTVQQISVAQSEASGLDKSDSRKGSC